MGMHNRITEKKYYEIKPQLNTPADDRKVIKKYGVCKSTAQHIRNTLNYDHYRLTSTTNRKIEKRLEEIMKANPIPEHRLEYENYQLRQSTPYVAIFVVLLIVALLVITTAILFAVTGGSYD